MQTHRGALRKTGVDVTRSAAVDHSLQIQPGHAMFPSKQAPGLISAIESALPSGRQLGAILCVSGGFAAGDAQAPELLAGTEDMFARSVFPSFISVQLAARFLRPGGLLLLPGAAVGGNTPTPWGLSYGASKGAVHHLVKSLAAPGSGLPHDVTVVGLAPSTLDTDANRAAMPDADFSSWTPLQELADEVCKWAVTPSLCTNGGIYHVTTKEGQTSYRLA